VLSRTTICFVLVSGAYIHLFVLIFNQKGSNFHSHIYVRSSSLNTHKSYLLMCL